MVNIYKWLKLASDNKTIIISIITALGGIIGTAVQTVSGQEKAGQLDAAIYSLNAQSQYILELHEKPEDIGKATGVPPSINNTILAQCRAMVDALRDEINEEYH